MRVVFRLDGVEHLGEARDISTCGAFVVSDQRDLPERLELQLGSGNDPLTVLGDVLRVTPDGFAVAFDGLGPDSVVRLDQLLNPQENAEGTAEAQIAVSAGTIQVTTSDWTPPVSEPTLHQYRPESDLVPPPPGKPQSAAWEGLPTISPQVTMEAPPPVRPAPPRTVAPDPEPHPPETPPAAAPAAEPFPQEASPANDLDPAPPLPIREPEPVAEPTTEPVDDAAAGIDRRRYERFEQSVPVVFDTLTSLIKEFTHNISFGGFFVYTTRPMKKGEDIAVTLVHPVHGERLTLLAKVAHAGSAPTPDPLSGEQRYGIGVEFRLPLPELKRMLSEFISSHQKQQEHGEATRVIQEARAVLNRGAGSQHALLGIDREAPMETIRRAYFQLVDRFHPDRFFDKVSVADRKLLEELFRKLTKAYEELTR